MNKKKGKQREQRMDATKHNIIGTKFYNVLGSFHHCVFAVILLK